MYQLRDLIVTVAVGDRGLAIISPVRGADDDGGVFEEGDRSVAGLDVTSKKVVERTPAAARLEVVTNVKGRGGFEGLE